MASPALEDYQIGWICALTIEAAAAAQEIAGTNLYILGRHWTTSTAMVATNMVRTFSNYPTGTSGGALQCDMKEIGNSEKLTCTGSLKGPPKILLAAVDQMRTAALREDALYPLYIRKAVQRNTRTCRSFSQPDQRHDQLFQTQYEHSSDAATCDGCLAEWERLSTSRTEN
ncbi:hypothetical protein BDW60DRAFT_218023 [Aspergillus nidulans var. acristatus]